MYQDQYMKWCLSRSPCLAIRSFARVDREPSSSLCLRTEDTDWLAEAAFLSAVNHGVRHGCLRIRPPIQHHVRSLPPDAPIFCSRTATPFYRPTYG
ncbi:hypothetical protein GQ600_1957 [Phytophthora cactorum]|nr:hypothetical protein GQ600_1957 [Phytophthora cactorum]